MNTFVDVLAALDRRDVGIRLLDTAIEALSWAELGASIRGNALRFAAAGVRGGDRVALFLVEDVEHVVTALALIALGAVPMSIKPPRGRPDDAYLAAIDGIVARHHVRFTAASMPTRPGVRHLRWDAGARSADVGVYARVAPSDVAFVQFSSGSLGDPKAVPVRHESLLDNAAALARVDGRTSASIGGSVVPLCHDMGWIGLLSCLPYQNSANVCATQRFLRRPLEFLASLEVCDTLAMPDFLLRYLDRALRARPDRVPHDLMGRLRTVFCGSEPIRYATVASFLEAAVPFGFDPSALVFSYGLAEATLIATGRRVDDLERSFVRVGERRIARVGPPVPGMSLAIVDGTVRLRGPSVFAGYLDGPRLVDGWHDTGDVGFLTDGELCVTGRNDDLILINGENLFPVDIEAHVEGLHGVAECVALSHGDGFSLYVVGPEVDLDMVGASVAQRFGAAPVAMRTGPRSGVPRTTSGKPRRNALLQVFAGPPPAAAP